MPVSSDSYNQAVQEWGGQTRQLLSATGSKLGIEHRPGSSSKGASLGKIRDKYGFDSAGFINKVSFTTINRSLIFTSVGAGKGIGGSKGSRWIDKYGNTRKTDPRSLGKLGSGTRTLKPFIDNTLESPDGIEKLGDIVAQYQADAIIDSVFVK